MTDRIWVAACVAIVVLAGCQQTKVDQAPARGATGAQVTQRKVAALEQNASADGEKAAPFSVRNRQQA